MFIYTVSSLKGKERGERAPQEAWGGILQTGQSKRRGNVFINDIFTDGFQRNLNAVEEVAFLMNLYVSPKLQLDGCIFYQCQAIAAMKDIWAAWIVFELWTFKTKTMCINDKNDTEMFPVYLSKPVEQAFVMYCLFNSNYWEGHKSEAGADGGVGVLGCLETLWR